MEIQLLAYTKVNGSQAKTFTFATPIDIDTDNYKEEIETHREYCQDLWGENYRIWFTSKTKGIRKAIV